MLISKYRHIRHSWDMTNSWYMSILRHVRFSPYLHCPFFARCDLSILMPQLLYRLISTLSAAYPNFLRHPELLCALRLLQSPLSVTWACWRECAENLASRGAFRDNFHRCEFAMLFDIIAVTDTDSLVAILSHTFLCARLSWLQGSCNVRCLVMVRHFLLKNSWQRESM